MRSETRDSFDTCCPVSRRPTAVPSCSLHICLPRRAVDVYHCLYQSLSCAELSFPVPDTIFTSADSKDVFLTRQEDDSPLQIYEGENALKHFLKKCGGADGVVFQSESQGTQILSGRDEMENAWTSSHAGEKRMQMRGNEKRLIRVEWNRSEGTKRFVMDNQSGETDATIRRKYRSVSSVSQPETTSFQYIGKLKPSSFSPYMPYQSTLKPASMLKLTETDLSKRQNSVVFPEKIHSRMCVTELETPVPEAEDMLESLRDLLNRSLVEEETLEAFAYDVMERVDGAWVLLDVEWLETKRFPVPEETNSSQISSPDASGSRSSSRLRDRFASVMATSVTEKLPYIDLKDIQERKISIYSKSISHSASPSHPPQDDFCMKSASRNIVSANQKLDSLLEAANQFRTQNRHGETVKLEAYRPDLLNLVIDRVYFKVTHDPDLKQFFIGKCRQEIDMIKIGFGKAFLGVDNFYFKKNVKKVHEGLGITSRVFQSFLQIFRQTLMEEGVSADDVEIVNRHLSRFSDEVTEEET